MTKKLILSFLLIAVSISLLPREIQAFKSIEDLKNIRETSSPYEKGKPTESAKVIHQYEIYKYIREMINKSTTGRELLQTADHLTFQFNGFADGIGWDSHSIFKSLSGFLTYPNTGVLTLPKYTEPADLTNSDDAIFHLVIALSKIVNTDQWSKVRKDANTGESTSDNMETYITEMNKLIAEDLYWAILVSKDLNLHSEHIDEWLNTYDKFDPSSKPEQIVDLLAKKLRPILEGNLTQYYRSLNRRPSQPTHEWGPF